MNAKRPKNDRPIQMVPCFGKHGPNTFALRVEDETMDSGDADAYRVDDFIFIAPDVEPIPDKDDVVVLLSPEDPKPVLRRLVKADGVLKAKALHPIYSKEAIPLAEQSKIIGVVTGSSRYMYPTSPPEPEGESG